MTIITTRVDPPIPTTMYDWMAYDDQGDETMTGRGPTEADALRDLCEQFATKWFEAPTISDIGRAVREERAACATACAIHSQYPITTDYDRGYNVARLDAAAAVRNRK